MSKGGDMKAIVVFWPTMQRLVNPSVPYGYAHWARFAHDETKHCLRIMDSIEKPICLEKRGGAALL
jgi:hypothetical protein